MTVILWNDNGVYRADSTAGEIASGSDCGAVLQTVHDSEGSNTRVHIAGNVTQWDTQLTITANQFSITAGWATLLATSSLPSMIQVGTADNQANSPGLYQLRFVPDETASEAVRLVNTDGLTMSGFVIERPGDIGVHALGRDSSGTNCHKFNIRHGQINDGRVGILTEPDTESADAVQVSDYSVWNVNGNRLSEGTLKAVDASRLNLQFIKLSNSAEPVDYTVKLEGGGKANSTRGNYISHVSMENPGQTGARAVVIDTNGQTTIDSTVITVPYITPGREYAVEVIADSVNASYTHVGAFANAHGNGDVVRLDGRNGGNVRGTRVAVGGLATNGLRWSDIVTEVGGTNWTVVNGLGHSPFSWYLPTDNYGAGDVTVADDGAVYIHEVDGTPTQIRPAAPTNLSGNSGLEPGWQARDDGSNTAGAGAVCTWVDTDGDGVGDAWLAPDGTTFT